MENAKVCTDRLGKETRTARVSGWVMEWKHTTEMLFVNECGLQGSAHEQSYALYEDVLTQ